MLILIERAQLPHFLATFRDGFLSFENELDHVEHSPHDPEELYSAPLLYIDQCFDALSAMLRSGNERDQSNVGLLERVLRQTPYNLADRGAVPTSEKDVRQAVFDVLKTVF